MNSGFVSRSSTKKYLRDDRKRRLLEEDLQERIKEHLSNLADTGMFHHYDPVRMISELFTQTFERSGTGLLEQAAKKQQDMRLNYTPNAEQKNSGNFYSMFSEHAFKRGNLSAAILKKKGAVMLVGSLKKTIGQPEPFNEKQRVLSGCASRDRTMSGLDTQLWTNNQAKSAVGLVLKSGRSSLRWFSDIQRIMESNQNGESKEELQALYRILPFMDLNREKQLMGKYEEKIGVLKERREGLKSFKSHSEADLKELERISSQMRFLEKAIEQIQDVIRKKRTMQMRFKDYLNHLSRIVNKFMKDAQEIYETFRVEPEIPLEEPEPKGTKPGLMKDQKSASEMTTSGLEGEKGPEQN